MYEKEFNFFESIVNIEDFLQECMNNYSKHINSVVHFNNSIEDLQTVFEMYKDSLLKMIHNSDSIKDDIMHEDSSTIRHDLDFEKTVHFSKVAENPFKKSDDLNHYEERARVIIILTLAKLINHYGMDALQNNQDQISKEMILGVFEVETNSSIKDEKKEKIRARVELYDTFGEEAIPYIENLDLLNNRVQSLRDFTSVPEEIQKIDALIQKLNTARTMINKKDKNVFSLLEQCYSSYESINRTMLVSRLSVTDQNVIDDPNDQTLLLLHFIPAFDNNNDLEQDAYFKKFIKDAVKANIEAKYGREFNPETDLEEAQKMIHVYMESKKNPFDLRSRIPIKNIYTASSYDDVITKPHTTLSCSISTVGDLHPHLQRKIAIGFTSVPIEAIKSINAGYNNSLDRFSFEENSKALPEVLEYIKKSKLCTNETLVDWTKLQPAYIMVVKDTPELSEDLLREAQKYSEMTGLPIKIYDSYEIEKRKTKQNSEIENQPIEGSFKTTDLAKFATIPRKIHTGIIQFMKGLLKSKTQELGGPEK